MSKSKGEVGFDADGKRYTLVFSIDALCNLEEAAGCSIAKIGKIWADPDQPQLHIVKAAFWAALTDNHPDITKQEASRLMASLGFVQAGQLVLEAFSLAFPEAKQPVPLEVKPRANSRRSQTGSQPIANG